jgi:hypothetical protein
VLHTRATSNESRSAGGASLRVNGFSIFDFGLPIGSGNRKVKHLAVVDLSIGNRQSAIKNT